MSQVRLSTHEALERIIRPHSVVVVGASTNAASMAGAPLANLVDSGYRGKVYAVNPRRESVMGVKSYPSIGSLDEPVDTAIVVTSAPQVAEVLSELREVTDTATIITAGFGAVEGAPNREEIGVIIRESGLRVLGPNTAGLLNLNDNYIPRGARNHPPESVAGPIALISQSGGVGNTIFSRGQSLGMPIGLLVGTGDSMDLTVWDAACYAIEGGHAQTVMVVVEAALPCHELSRLADVARQGSAHVVLLKMARTAGGQRAAMSHTGSMASDARVGLAAAESLGFVVARDLDEVWQLGWLNQSWGKPPARPALGVYCRSGGLAVEAADLADELHLSLPHPQVAGEDDPIANPFDPGDRPIPNDQMHDRHAYLVKWFGELPELNCCLYALPVMSEALAARSIPATLEGLAELKDQRVALSMFSAGAMTDALRLALRSSEYPVFDGLRSALGAITAYLRPPLRPDPVDLGPGDLSLASEERSPLSYWSSRRKLDWIGVPFPPAILALDAAAARAFAGDHAGGIVLKVSTTEVTHKLAAGLVRLGISTGDQAATAYAGLAERASALVEFDGIVCEARAEEGLDLILAATRHDDFGPFVSVGSGGWLAEGIADLQIIFPPFTTAALTGALARTLVGRYLIERQVPTDHLVATIIRLGDHLVADTDAVEYEVNPLRVSPIDGSCLAVDALVFVRGKADGARSEPAQDQKVRA